MHVRSKLKEPDRLLYDFKLPEDDSILFNSVLIDEEGLLSRSYQCYTAGFCVIHNYFKNEELLTDLVEIKGDHIKIVYVQEGTPILQFSNETQLGPQRGFLTLGMESDCSKIARHPSGTSTEVIFIYITREYYLQMMQKEEWSKDHEFWHQVKKYSFDSQSKNIFPINLAVQQIIGQLTKNNTDDITRKYFLDLKIRELMLHLYSFEKQETALPVCQNKIAPAILQKITLTKEYIDQHLEDTPTLKQLSKLFTLNELQLKNNFKEVYHTTIRSYIINMKMKKALTLLENHKINETAAQLGYQSVPHFITTFKKHHGQSPSRFLKSKESQ